MAANPSFIALDFGEGRQVLAGVVSEGRGRQWSSSRKSEKERGELNNVKEARNCSLRRHGLSCLAGDRPGSPDHELGETDGGNEEQGPTGEGNHSSGSSPNHQTEACAEGREGSCASRRLQLGTR